MFRKMPFILMVVIAAIMLIDLPDIFQQFLYSISVNIKSLIITILPIIIFCLLFNSMVNLSNNAGKLIGVVLILVCLSNLFSTSLAHFLGSWVYGFDMHIITPPAEHIGMEPLWYFSFPKLIENDKAMFLGIILGLINAKLFSKNAKIYANIIDKIIHKILGILVYIIPLFVAGFVVKLQSDGVIQMILKDYASIFLVVGSSIIIYNLSVYFILSDFNVKKYLTYISNIFPAAISGFCTMSSAASMPLTIIGVERNSDKKDIAKSIVPATVNIHLVGDCFAIPIFAYAVLKSYGAMEPSLVEYMVFALYFVIAKFSVAAIPGGGILVMLPILERHLGFTGEMMSLITSIYILFDPVITFGNVFGNGAFAKAIDRLYFSNTILNDKIIDFRKMNGDKL